MVVPCEGGSSYSKQCENPNSNGLQPSCNGLQPSYGLKIDGYHGQCPVSCQSSYAKHEGAGLCLHGSAAYCGCIVQVPFCRVGTFHSHSSTVVSITKNDVPTQAAFKHLLTSGAALLFCCLGVGLYQSTIWHGNIRSCFRIIRVCISLGRPPHGLFFLYLPAGRL